MAIFLPLYRPLCPNGMQIIGWCCSTSCTEAKDTLDYVPWLVIDCFVLLFTVAPFRESSFTSLHQSYPSSPFLVSAASSHTPVRSITTCSHHHIPTCAPGALSNPSHRYHSDLVGMYCTTVFWRCLMYSSTNKTPTSSRAIADEVYFYFLFGVLRRRRPVSRLATWAWNSPRDLPMRG